MTAACCCCVAGRMGMRVFTALYAKYVCTNSYIFECCLFCAEKSQSISELCESASASPICRTLYVIHYGIIVCTGRCMYDIIFFLSHYTDRITKVARIK